MQEWAWKDFLATFGVVFQQTYTLSLIGEHIYRLMKHYQAIFDFTQELLINNLQTSKTSQTIESIEELISKATVKELVTYICHDTELGVQYFSHALAKIDNVYSIR